MSRAGAPRLGRQHRLDSLFTRLLLAQILLAAGLALLFYALFLLNRNVTLAELYAERWAPALAQAAASQATPQPALSVQVRTAAPVGSVHISLLAPRIAALRAALAERGVAVDAVAIHLDKSRPVVWLQVKPARGTPLWLGVAAEHLVISGWSWRLAIGLGMGLALLVGVSWRLTRWLTRPLEQLSARISAHAPGGTQAGPSHAMNGPGTAPEIAQIDAAFSDLLARQAQHERERAMLLAGVSHDLRSPLARIRVAAELLPDIPEITARRDAIIRNVAESDRLTESFLDFVRAGELRCDQTADLAAVARALVAATGHPADVLRIDAPDTLPYPRCNPLLIERLLANLLDNAFKHGRSPVRLRIAQHAHEVRLEVLDAGAGVPPAARPSMLEAFSRGDASRSVPGTGLGLAIVRQIASRMGGTVSFIDAAEWHGVRVTLPHGD